MGLLVPRTLEAGTAAVTWPPIPGGQGSVHGTLDRLAACREDLGQPSFHAAGHVVLRIHAQRPRRQLVCAAVVTRGERTAGQPDDGDRVAGVQRHHPRVHVPRLIDLVDVEEPVGLQDLLDHRLRLLQVRTVGPAVTALDELVEDEAGPCQQRHPLVERRVIDDICQEPLEDETDGGAFRKPQRLL